MFNFPSGSDMISIYLIGFSYDPKKVAIST